MDQQPPIQPQPEPQQNQLQTPQSQTSSSPQPVQDPGKGLGIAGFILAFVGVQVVGLILSIIGYHKSKKAGIRNGLALAGIILNAVFMVIGVGLIALLTIVSYNGVTVRANDAAAHAAVVAVEKSVEQYATNNNALPTATSEIATPGVTFSSNEITSQPSNPETVNFSTCGTDGARIGYWDYTSEKASYTYSGNADAQSTCTIVK